MTEAKEFSLLYESVGRALSAWSMVEHHICDIFSAVIITDRNLAVGYAHSAFWAVESFHGKLNMVDASIKLRCRSDLENYEGLLLEWATIYKRAREKNNSRNELAHGTVMSFGNYAPPEIYFIPSFFRTLLRDVPFTMDRRPKNRLTAQQIDDRTRAFKEFSKRLLQFYLRLQKELEDDLSP